MNFQNALIFPVQSVMLESRTIASVVDSLHLLIAHVTARFMLFVEGLF